MINLWIDGIPKGQPRARAFAKHGRVRMYDPGTAEAWKAQVALSVKRELPESPMEGPVAVVMAFALPRPKSLTGKRHADGAIPHTGKPDADNLCKAVLDALTQIGLWRDDSQVCAVSVVKNYASKTGRPGMALEVVEVGETED
jgi:Holliday junction resolvase RusA-like endonuclease